MKIGIKKALQDMRKQNRERVNELRQSLQQKLEEKCVENGGHFFWDWQENLSTSIGGYVLHTHVRQCRACRFTEYKVEEYGRQEK